MAVLNVNWNGLKELGNTTEENILEFEKNRILLEEQFKNIPNYWQGGDSVVFQQKTLEYVTDLKKDVDYLYEWATYFKRMSNIFNSVEDDGLQHLRNTMDMLSESEKESILGDYQ